MRTLVTIAALVLLVSCGGPSEVDIDSVESDIASTLDDRGVPDASVDCPDSVEWSTGDDFHCIVTAGDETVRVTVSMENDDGDVTWVVG